ncbi:hypothetical protein HXP44_25925 [Streptomyces sioyaensis]|uniref:YdhR family protein n=1 Tax=Streptomyces sioyaensis TaxID=67364 RepID=A0A4Q1QVE3_9ACTN|nr:hypothetical protein [Streptomyces sioyaensis]MBM4795404.1 hypothetical protein [Streptomyces sioyaensis]RXS66245.1 hypothetical protein EST54_15910 [Streptomyces sioyaensis]
MRAMVAWWDLQESDQTIESLRDFLRDEAVEAWNRVPGLIHKYWVADQENDRWGAVFIWESAEAAAPPHPRSAAELIGYPPTHRWVFDIEAVAEGVHALPRLAGLGLALQA